MGIRFNFICPRCRYEAVASGGTDARAGMITKTVECRECRVLADVTVARRHDRGWDQYRPACPTNHEHPVDEWLFEGACPRCGTPMKADEACMPTI